MSLDIEQGDISPEVGEKGCTTRVGAELSITGPFINQSANSPKPAHGHPVLIRQRDGHPVLIRQRDEELLVSRFATTASLW